MICFAAVYTKIQMKAQLFLLFIVCVWQLILIIIQMR